MAILRFYSTDAFNASRLTQILHALQQVRYYINIDFVELN